MNACNVIKKIHLFAKGFGFWNLLVQQFAGYVLVTLIITHDFSAT